MSKQSRQLPLEKQYPQVYFMNQKAQAGNHPARISQSNLVQLQGAHMQSSSSPFRIQQVKEFDFNKYLFLIQNNGNPPQTMAGDQPVPLSIGGSAPTTKQYVHVQPQQAGPKSVAFHRNMKQLSSS